MKTLVTIFFLSIFANVSSAQVTITSDQFLSAFNSGGTATTYSSTDTTGLSALIQAVGPSQDWKLGARSFAPTTTAIGTLVPYSTTLPLATDPDLSSATHVLIDTTDAKTMSISYEYIKITQDGMYLIGDVTVMDGTATKNLVFTPALQEFKFPMTYQTTWHSESAITGPNIPMGATASETVDGNVDSYGTLHIPSNGAHDALRARTILTLAYNLGPLGSQSSVTNTFGWYMTDGYSASIAADKDLKPTSVDYNVPVGGPASVRSTTSSDMKLHLSENPVVDGQSDIEFSLPEGGLTEVQLIDVTGNVAATYQNGFLSNGVHSVRANMSEFPAGTYLVRVASASGTSSTKIAITK